MNKKMLALAGAFVLSVSGAIANPAAIDFKNVTGDEKLTEKIWNFGNYYPQMQFYTGRVSEEAISSGIELKAEIEKIKKPGYDVQLLKLLVLRCLYNADKATYKEIDGLFTSLNKKFKKRSEHHWIYANFLITTMDNARAFDEAMKYCEMNDGCVSVDYMYDFAYIMIANGLRHRAMDLLKTAASLQEKDVSEMPYYDLLSKTFENPDLSKSYAVNDVWYLNPSKNKQGNYHFDSSMLGISIALKPTWNFKATGYEPDGVACFYLKPDLVKTKFGDISYSLVLTAIPESSKIEKSKFIESMITKTGAVKKESKAYHDVNWDYYEYENLETYNDARNGSKGYILTATIQPSENSGFGCEHIVDMKQLNETNQAEEATKYLNLGKTYTRLQKPIEIMILVDGCNLIDKEVQAFLEDFMSKKLVVE